MKFFKGDTIKIQCTVDTDITDWKIRASLKDFDSNEVKIATANSSGSDEQIEKTSIGTSESVFLLKFASGETDNFNDTATLEIEVDTGSTINDEPEIYTLLSETIKLKDQKIDWTEPS